jgi:hypothetical protein
MASIAAFSWRRLAPTMRQFVDARLRDTPPILHTRLSVPWVTGIGACCFLLPYLLWWLLPTARVSAPARPPAGIEVHHILTALQAVLAEPSLGRRSDGSPAPFALTDVEVELHFVVQKNVHTSSDSSYRLVPVDTMVQARPEHVQTLKMHLIPSLTLPNKLGAPGSAPAGPRATEEVGLLKPALPKKREKP